MIPLAITAVALSSSLGLNSEEACAAARAGLVRVSQIDSLNTAIDPAFCKETLEGIPPIVAHTVPAIAGGHAGAGKLLALALPALDDLRIKCDLSAASLERTGLYLCLTDTFYISQFGEAPEPLGEDDNPSPASTWQAIVSSMPRRLCQAAGLAVPPSQLSAIGGGRVGLQVALHRAARAFADGMLDRCIVGTLESMAEPQVLTACAAARVLKSDANPVGFMPGEAAAFLLVEPVREGMPPAGLQIMASAYTADVPYLHAEKAPVGRGISKTVVEVLQACGARMPPLLVADLNGTEPRATDWGHALVHLRDRLGEFDTELWLPVDSFGETGAAHGGLGLCMLYEAARRGQLPGRSALMVLCGDGGARGSLLLQASPTIH